MLRPWMLTLSLLTAGCAPLPHQTHTQQAPPECLSHADEIDCTWRDVRDARPPAGDSAALNPANRPS